MKYKHLLFVVVVLFSVVVVAQDSEACVWDSDCSYLTGWSCSGSTRAYYVGDCQWVSVYSKQCRSVYQYGSTCANGCSNGLCITAPSCKSNGQTCSQPGTSGSECCSTLCQANGQCGTNTCSNTCSSRGAKKCSSGNAQTCDYHDNNVCLSWETVATCGGGCTGGDCVQCTQNSHCESDYQFCKSGNRVFKKDYSCSGYNACQSEETEIGDCDDQDNQRCKSDTVLGEKNYFCNSGSCDWGWTGLTTCAYGCSDDRCNDPPPCKNNGQTCSSPSTSTNECCSTLCQANGQCGEDTCSNECSSGETRCSGDGQETCGNYDNDVCLEFGAGQSCAHGCSNGNCNDAPPCKNNGQTCSSPGASTNECCSTLCQANGQCGEDTCSNECTPNGAKRCSGSTEETCGDYNDNVCLEWGGYVGCSNGCSDNSCISCKANGQTCSSPGTSTNECCSGICQDDGECGTNACTIPDGSADWCDCNSDTDCPSNYYCNFASGPDGCEEIQYDDECSNHNGYFCDNGDVYNCNDNGNYYEKKLIEVCNTNTYCNPQVVDGTQKCSKQPVHMDLWIDYASQGTEVNKQISDSFTINIFAESSTTIDLSFAESAFEGTCSKGSQTIQKGTTTCSLTVKPGSKYKGYTIRANEKVAKVRILPSPQFIFLTDSEQLKKRYPHEERGVQAVLKKAYENAEDSGIVYDLAQYRDEIGKSNPFTSFSSYHEKATLPYMRDNSYSLAVSNFIKERCGECEDIIILGDDFILPHYRRDLSILEKRWWFWNDITEETIYTDTNYKSAALLEFSNYYEMFKFQGKYDGKPVLIIYPDQMNNTMKNKIDELKDAFKRQGYNPNFENSSGKEIHCVDERWFAKVRGHTLIIVGTEENNNAFACMPFVSGEDQQDGIFLQPNVWDSEEYALVINTEDPAVIAAFASLVKGGQIINLTGHSAYTFKVGVQYASYAALGVGVLSMTVVTGGTGAPAAFLIAAGALDAIADAGDIVDTCAVNNEGNFWCGTSIAFAGVPFIPGKPVKKVLKSLSDPILNTNMFKMFEPVDNLIEKYFRNVRSSPKIGNEAFETVTVGLYDNIYMAKGSEKFLKGNIGKLDSLPNHWTRVENARFIKSIGEAEDGLQISEAYLKEIEIVDFILGGTLGSYDSSIKKIKVARTYEKVAGSGTRYIQNADESIEITIKEEMAHAKIDELLKIAPGDSMFEHIDYFDEDKIIRDIANIYDDLTAYRLLIEKLADNKKFIAEVQKIGLNPLTKDILKSMADDGEYHELFQIKAKALIFKDNELIKIIDEVIPTGLRGTFDEKNANSLISGYIENANPKKLGEENYLEKMNYLVQEIRLLVN